MLERSAFKRFVAKRDVDTLAAARGKRDHLVGGERPLCKNPKHLAAHIAGSADDGDFVTHVCSPL